MKKIENLIIELSKHYDYEHGSLDYCTPFELLVAVELSAQCTDARVNIVTKELFKVANTAEKFASMKLSEIEKLISSISFYKNKAKHLRDASKILVEKYNGEVPKTMEEIMSLPGVGRKTANVVLLEAFGICEGIAVDTHAFRLSHRMGLSDKDDPLKVEQDLLKKIPKEYWPRMNHIFVDHGRKYCTAQKPKCDECPINKICEKKI